ncbi:peptide-methionine (S)-S-oxide reductase MsrA [Sulfitobacter donghicola]|uniref:Peptide methionine sulfoxide reductase MsrA n=1 Tax=Sulfitobacter donghicola DSW-25 = KCTC 12864 = JCM 14565 TaxID=1300350 RepID=A0A073IMD6_9RHOB|nr:peptide-methionine (S)-S-oxide reductase MsrA [Sulfitobacter donghicola]KEJ90661.1 peptide methionine sulfoxide reductase MsrA [Sulfitobacter donghicola DSW-25 = KCTC 12864 = JCM 14565]KIN67911.1 Peptide methionine sulfoxide reductase MsrA [Sulfitobacter donghicola DSW-25 = KCTC 12864 = JCM 14565]
MSTINNFKSFALAGLIAIGLFAQASPSAAAGSETLTVAGGCFWCVEADFEKVKGVKEAVSGFAGGKAANPTYKQVTSGGTGHYEAVQITFDPDVVSAGQLLDMFFRSVDPTDAGGQFCDRGASYRTAIFATPSQKAAAIKSKEKAQSDLGQKIVTPVLGAAKFYPADAYHQDYSKSKKIVVTRFGPKSKANAYKAYRNACGRDQRVKELWGSAAPFAG